jgi:hypothetical protein
VLGPIIIAIIIVIAIPVSLMVTGLLVSAVFSWSLTTDAEDRNEGSELIELNK